MENSSDNLQKYLEQKEQLMAERWAKLKKGPNVIHLSYSRQHISPDELEQLESDTKYLGLELSSMDISGIPFNSISSVAGDIVLMLSEPGIVGVLTSGLLTNGLYDGLKTMIVKLWEFAIRKPTVTITSTTMREHQTKFHLNIKLGEDRFIELKTENLDSEQLGIAIDKISQAAKELSDQKRDLMEFDIVENKWFPIKVDIAYLKKSEKFISEMPLNEYFEELKKGKVN